ATRPPSAARSPTSTPCSTLRCVPHPELFRSRYASVSSGTLGAEDRGVGDLRGCGDELAHARTDGTDRVALLVRLERSLVVEHLVEQQDVGLVARRVHDEHLTAGFERDRVMQVGERGCQFIPLPR